MVLIAIFAGFGYLAILLTGVFFSLTSEKGKQRGWIRFATIAFSLPLCALLVLITLLWASEPPTLEALQRAFPSRKGDLETILRMSNEDSQLSRIAPTFLDLYVESTHQFGQYSQGDPNAPLSETRWNAYRKLYDRNAIKLGIQRDQFGDAFIMVDSVGLLNRGHTSGYLHCSPLISKGVARYEPCILRQAKGQREFNPNTREEAYSFQRVDGNWYAYDEGPS